MKYKTVTVREGELLGPVDWSYNFRQHFDCYSCPDAYKDELCARAVALLREVSENPEAFRATFSHGDAERYVYQVGMYDGWPYWKPTPALLCSGVFGADWHFFYDLRGVSRIEVASAITTPESGVAA